MGALSPIRSRRRSAGERHALAQIEREIRATDPNSRRKYLREFNQAFTTYESVLTPEQLQAMLGAADVLLVGDYHALPESQRWVAGLLPQLQRWSGRPLVLGIETVFARDQHILDEWWRGAIDQEELRERIRYDLDWGYDWRPFYELLESARHHALALYGLDCMPRHDLRKIAARDRHAADKIAEARARHPQAVVVALFGESHLAPNHIPLWLAERLPRERVLTALQNIDQLYWRAAGERRERVEAVRVQPDVLCVFNSTPLEKYESYRLCIERWRQERPSGEPDLAPTVYNLIDALLRFLNIDKYAPHNGRQPRFLVDQLPEVYTRSSEEALRKLLARKGAGEAELEQLAQQGICYWAPGNAVFVREFHLAHATEAAAQFVHRACRGAGEPLDPAPSDRFYARVLELALAYFGSRVLYPAREPVRESALYALYAQPREAIEEKTVYSYREYMQMIDFLVLHKDFEAHVRQYHYVPDLMREGVEYTGEKFDYCTRQLGAMLGSELYDAYVGGRLGKRLLRSLYFRRLEAPGAARTLYFRIARRLRQGRKRPLAA